MHLPEHTGRQYVMSTDESKQRVTYHPSNVTAQTHISGLQFTAWPHVELRWGKEGEEKKTFKWFPKN